MQSIKQPNGQSGPPSPPGDGGAAPQIDVSVIIPAYNAAQTIVRALDSVRIQQGVSIEIIVIDDASADETVAVVTAATRPGESIRMIRMPVNRGVSAARNAGIQMAQGRFLAFLDADDIWLPGKLRQQVTRMDGDPTLTLISCNSKMVSADGVVLKVGHLNRRPVEGLDAWKTLLVYNFLPTPTVLTRTELVKQIGGFDETLAVGEDLDLWIKLGLRGRIAVLSDTLINYYDMAGSLMKRHRGQTQRIVLPMLERHLIDQRDRLTGRELRRIRGGQAFEMACDLFFSGNYRACVPIFIKAAGCGTRPVKSLLYVPRALLMELVRMSGARVD
ncbi:MAG: glycosyltransferase [Pseudomonadota bacterium]